MEYGRAEGSGVSSKMLLVGRIAGDDIDAIYGILITFVRNMEEYYALSAYIYLAMVLFE